MPVVTNGNGNGSITWQYIGKTLVGVFAALALAMLGWIKSNVDNVYNKLVQIQITQATNEERIAEIQKDEDKLRAEVDNHNDWILSQLDAAAGISKAEAAKRILRNGIRKPY